MSPEMYNALAKRFSTTLFRIIENQDLNNKQKIIKLEYILDAINKLDNDLNDVDLKNELNKLFIKYQIELRV